MFEPSLYQPLGKHLAVARNGTTQSQVQFSTEYPVTRIETIADGTINFGKVGYLAAPADGYELQPGDILYSHINSIKHVGKVAQYVDEENTLYHGMNLLLLRLDGEVDKRYFFHYLNSYNARHYAQKECQKAINQVSLNTGQLKKLSVFTPPLPEQRLIAHILDTLDTQIQKTEALIAKLEKVKEGLLHDLLTRGIDENGQLRPSPEQAPELYKESPLGLIPKQWSSMTIGEALENKIILSIQDGNHGEVHPKNSEFTVSGYPFVMANDIRENEIDFESCHKIPESIKNRLRVGFSKEGDVLLSHKGTIGNCAMVPIGAGCVILTPQVTYYRCNESSLRPEYLLSFFKSHIFQSPLYRLSGQTTRSYLGITGQKALSLLTPPIEEQDLIKNTISQIDQEVKGERKHLVKLKTQKDGLMDDLLTGRVRVTPLLEQAPATTPA